MANEVEIVITGHDRTGPMFSSLDRNIRRLNGSFGELRTSIRQTFNRINDDVSTSLADTVAMARARGRSIGQGLAEGIQGGLGGSRRRLRGLGSDAVDDVARGIRGRGREVEGAFGSVFNGGIRGALSTPVVGPVILAALAGAVTAIAPALGVVVGSSLALGIGGGIAGIGIAALFHTEDIDEKWSKSEQKRVEESNKSAEKLKKVWRETNRSVIEGIREAAQPMLPVIETARKTLLETGKELKPAFESAFAVMKGPLGDFIKNLGEGLENLGPSLVPLSEAFNTVLDAIGPQLPGLFTDISDAFISLSGTIDENKDNIGNVFHVLMETIPVTISLVDNLMQAFDSLTSFAMSAWSEIGQFAISLQDMFLGVEEAMANLSPNDEWLTDVKKRRAALAEEKADWENMPKTFEVKGDISDLQVKLSQAKRGLNDPNLTKVRKAQLQAEIGQLKSAIAQARGALASIQGKTIDIVVRYSTTGRSTINGVASVGAHDRAHGGISGGGLSKFASGGISGGSSALVGEAGPEIVNLPFGSTVTPTGQSQAIMRERSGAGSNQTSTTFKSAVADTMSNFKFEAIMEKALKVVITMQEAMQKLTGGIFGQEKALSSYESAWDAALKSLKEHKKTLNIHTEAGRANRDSLMAIAESAHSVIFAMDELGKPTTSMVNKMAEQRAEFIKMARAMGMTSAAAKKLADSYGLIPSKVKAAETAEDKAIADNKKITAANKKIEARNKANGTAATGGPRGGMTLVGELGPEVVKLPFGSQVMPAGATAGMGSPGGGGGELHITLQIGKTTIGELIIDPLRKSIRDRGGNVQAVLGKVS